MKQRILLIEPDSVLARTYKAALGRAGFAVDWQVNAQGAISSVDHAKPSIIVLDLQLAEHNGVEFLHELRSYPDWQDIPVIILSSVAAEDLALNQKIRERLKIVDYLYEPHTKLSELIDSVKRAVKDE